MCLPKNVTETPYILCTGGMGYIGSHTIVKLIDAGYRVAILDNLCNSSPKVLDRLFEITGVNVPFFEVDILDELKMDELFKREKFDAVIHFAALKAVGESNEKPLWYYKNNIGGTVVLLETMRKFNCKKIVFSSSATVYQQSEKPLVETDLLGPSNPYGHTKRMMEQILTDMCVADDDLKVCLLRYFNPVGAHPSGRIGEAPQGCPNNLMPFIQQVGVGRREALNVFGDDWPTVDGTGVRDYIHVEDLARAHVKALDKIMDRLKGVQTTTTSLSIRPEGVPDNCLIYNLGSGKGSSVLEMVKEFEKSSGQHIPFKIVGRRKGDLAQVICDPTLANCELGWKTECGLAEIMRDAWKWQSMNPFGFDDQEKC